MGSEWAFMWVGVGAHMGNPQQYPLSRNGQSQNVDGYQVGHHGPMSDLQLCSSWVFQMCWLGIANIVPLTVEQNADVVAECM